MDGLRMEGFAGAAEVQRAQSLCERVDLLLELNRPAEAKPFAAEALTLDPEGVTPHCQMARVLKALGELPAALKSAEAAILADPEEEWGHRLRALILLDAGKGELAMEAALEAVRLDPEQPGVLHCIVRCAAATGRLKLARIWAERARDLHPGDATLHALFGTVAMDEQNWTEAEQHLRRSLEIDASCWSTVYNLGLVMQARGRHREAITHFYQAAQLAPTDRSTQSHLYGLITRSAGRACLPAVALALVTAFLLVRWLRMPWLPAGVIGLATGGWAYAVWERRWLASITVPVGDFYRRRRWWEIQKRAHGAAQSAWQGIATLAAIWMCLVPVLVAVTLVRLASRDWLTPLELIGLTAAAWKILKYAPHRAEEEPLDHESASADPGSEETSEEEVPDTLAPLVPLRALAHGTVAQVEAVLGAPQSVAPVLSQPELMPGEYREYLLREQGTLLVRFHHGRAISFSVRAGEGLTDSPVEALQLFFGLEPGRLTTWKRAATEQLWSGPAGGLHFTRLRVAYRARPEGGAEKAHFNSAEAVLQARPGRR